MSAILEQHVSAPPARRRFTRDEYYAMGEAGLFQDEHVELIEGEIYTMSPMSSLHRVCVCLCNQVIGGILPGDCFLQVQCPVNLSVHTEPEPDLAIIPGKLRDSVKEHPRTALWVIEVAYTTLAFDRNVKAPLYAKAGVPEYWIVNLVDRCIEVHTDIVTENGAARYSQCKIYQGSDCINPLVATDKSVCVADLMP